MSHQILPLDYRQWDEAHCRAMTHCLRSFVPISAYFYARKCLFKRAEHALWVCVGFLLTMFPSKCQKHIYFDWRPQIAPGCECKWTDDHNAKWQTDGCVLKGSYTYRTKGPLGVAQATPWSVLILVTTWQINKSHTETGVFRERLFSPLLLFSEIS